MKRKIFIVLFIAVISCLLLTACQDDGVPDGMKLASAESDSFNLYVPAPWIVDTVPGKVAGAHVSDSDRTSISVQRHLGADIDAWWEDYKSGFTLANDVNFTEGKEASVGGVNGKKYDFTFAVTQEYIVGYKFTVYAIPYGDSIYSISIAYPGTTQEGKTVYTDTIYAVDIAEILKHFKFNGKSGIPAEPYYEGENTPSGTKCASNIDIVDYYLYVPSSWKVENTQGAISSAYIDNGVKKTNVNVMQWNVGGSDTFDSWWSLYKEQLDEAFGKESYEITSAGVDAKLGENASKSYTYTLKMGNNTYDYLIYATMHRGMIYVMTFTFRSGDIIENYKTDIDIITKNFIFD